MIRALAGLGAACAVAGCAAGHQKLETACPGVLAASATGDAYAYTGRDKIVVVAGGHETRIAPTDACPIASTQWIFVSPRGTRVVLYGSASNIEGDMWGHSGRHVAAACTIDVASQTVQALPDGIGDESGDVAFVELGARDVLWHTNSAVSDSFRVVDGDRVIELAHPDGQCALAATGPDAAIAVCGGYQHPFTARRYRFDGEPHADGDDRRIAVPDVDSISGMALSSDGRTFMVWSAGLVTGQGDRHQIAVVDVARGAGKVVYDRTEDGVLGTVQLDPRGTGDLLLARFVSHGPDLDDSETILQVLGPDGAPRREARTHASGTQFSWTEPDAVWVSGGCGAERVRLE